MSRQELLQKAITGEYNAIRRYAEYARVAEKEKLPNVAYLFKAIVAGEKVHLENHKRALGEPFTPVDEPIEAKSTLENLKAALAGETDEAANMYPGFIKGLKRSKKEEDEITRLSFEWALGTEKTHAMVLQAAIDVVSQGKDYAGVTFFVCLACGSLHEGAITEGVCPVCKHDVRLYKEVQR
nr:rubrerythrin family protein [Candidatus Sigynarchaeum springense]MDO8116205.1 rubrerythrin family protein [Candidatus Sigynarchaeota archaeon]